MKSKQPLYILLTKNNSILSSAIRAHINGPYSHASIGLDLYLEELYSFARKGVRNPFNAGFIKENIEGGNFFRHPETMCALYRLDIDRGQYKLLVKNLNNYIYNHDKYRYSIVGLMAFLLKIPLERSYKMFCSQFVARLLRDSKIHDFEKPSSLVSPKDILNWLEENKIYEGELRFYRESLNKSFDISPSLVWEEERLMILQ